METLDDKTAKKLKRMMAVFDDDTMTRAEFLSAYEQVVKIVTTLKQQNMNEIEGLRSGFEKIKALLKEGNSQDFNNLRSQMKTDIGMLSARLDEKSKQIDEKMAQLRDGLDGVSPDPAEVAKQAAELIKLPEYRAPIMDGGEEIRNKLELLQGKERLGIGAIDNLREELDELKSRPVGRGGGGVSAIGVRQAFKHIAHTEQPTGAIDGANTTYTVKNEIFWLAGFTLNGEQIAQLPNFTISGRTITFASALPAAYSGKDFEVKYIG